MCQEEDLKPLELIKWIRTRWGSMYDLINRVLVNRAVCILMSPVTPKLMHAQAVDKFCLLADASTRVPNLQKKKYYDFSIVSAEWELLHLVHEVLQVGYIVFFV